MRDATDELFQELKDDEDEVAPDAITPEWLESVRSRIESGELPSILVTDYREGWLLYARGEIARRFESYRERKGGKQVRKFFPLAYTQPYQGGPWASSEDKPAEFAGYSLHRMKEGISTAVLLHGSALVASGQMTWDEAGKLAHSVVGQTIKDAKSEPTTTTGSKAAE